jgi:methyl-accepting chemotaxis protein
MEMAEKLEGILTGVDKVNELVGEIDAATKEQAEGIDQVNTAVAEMNDVTQQNASNSEESASAAEELNSQAEELSGMVENFELSQDTGIHNSPKTSANSAQLEGIRNNYGDNGSKDKSGKNREISPDDVIPLDHDDDIDDF